MGKLLIYLATILMEESDAMLITSIKDLITIPEDIATLRDIRTEHIFDIGCNAF